jgi:hypothetical protein
VLPATRIVIGVASVCALLLGLILIATGPVGAAIGALWLMVLGAVGLLGITFERMRYRSEAAERSGETGGQAGVDSGPPDPRFRPTEERFVDPTTRLRLRVWVDPSSGERRYRLDE